MDEQQKEQVNNLLEDGWFFGNTLISRTKPPKTMVRSYSDPCPSSSTKEKTLVSPQGIHPSNMMSNNALLRTPSLPVTLGIDRKYTLLEEEEWEEDEDDDDEPRMSDLIMQAMPIMPVTPPMPPSSRRLNRTPSLPPCRVVASNEGSNVQNGGKLSRNKVSVDQSYSSPLLQEKGPIAMTKLTRRTSIDSSMLLPPKSASKGTKQSGSNSKNRTQRKMEPTNMNKSPAQINNSKAQTLEKCKSLKSLSDLETQELQGFKDLGFSFDDKKVSPNTAQVLPALQRRASLDSNHPDIGKVRRPYLSEAWRKTSSPLSAPPLVPKWGDQKASSSNQDMKDQIKFWARAVASNVRQEC